MCESAVLLAQHSAAVSAGVSVFRLEESSVFGLEQMTARPMVCVSAVELGPWMVHESV